jgi:hypothetical protein
MQRAHLLALGVAALASVATETPEMARAEAPATPRVEAIAVAPTEIRLIVELADHSLHMSATGGPEGEPSRSWYVSTRQQLRTGRYVTNGSAIVSARPDTTYRFRVRAQVTRGADTEGRESDECVVKTPPEPREPPVTPSGVTVVAPSPFTLEVRWRSAGVPAYGFEIHRREEGGEFHRVGVAEPDARRFIDHGRRPGTKTTYRVRAFNPRGVSAWSATASGVTRPLAELAGPPHKKARVTCTSLDAEIARIADENSDAGVSGKARVCRDVVLDGGHRVDAVTIPSSCGAQNCSWTLYAEVEGCYRALGSFALVSPECPRFETVTTAADGWPVLRAYAHESASAASVAVHVFRHGGYVEVDHYVQCSSAIPIVRTADGATPGPSEDPTRWVPPFMGCW